MNLRLCVLYIGLLLPIVANGQRALEFIENKGQWSDWYRYKAETPAGDVLLENDGFRYVLCDPSNTQKIDLYHHGLLRDPPIIKFHIYKLSFEGARMPVLQGERPQSNYYNYYLGNDRSKWKSNIHPDMSVDYTQLYSGVDMHVTSEKGQMTYDFVISAGTDASIIRMHFDGQSGLNITNDNLVINTTVGQVMEMKPFAYQYINDTRVLVNCVYKIQNNVVTYQFPDGYDKKHTLVIDPTVVFCTFTGSTADNWGFTATYDNEGNFYLGGLVNALIYGGAYPVSTGAFQTTFGGGYEDSPEFTAYAADIGIMKLDPTGATRIYATYIGGSGNERPNSMIVDGDGNLIVAGRSNSVNYPVTSGAYDTSENGNYDIVVSKLSADGTSMIGSTYIGGSADDGINYDSTEYGFGQLKLNYGDDARSEVQVDKLGNIYVTGSTYSADFPTTSTAIATTISGRQDGVVFKFNKDLTTLEWSTYLSGSGSDAGYALAFDTSQQSIYVAGGTNSTDFPVTSGSWQSTYGGDSADGFILKFQNSSPYSLLKGTFVGTSNYDEVFGIQVDNDDNVYVMGQSLGGEFPVTSGVYSNPKSTQFVMKMDKDLSTDLISTVYGSGNSKQTNISPVAFLVDTCNNVFISGWGGNILAPYYGSAFTGTCEGMPVTPDAYQDSTDGRDFYFIVFSSGLASLRYATFYGRYSTTPFYGEHVDGGTSRFDKKGVIYQAICANCGGPSSPPFPTTAGSWATVDGSPNCNEAGLKIAFNLGPVSAHVSVSPDTVGCAPFTVTLLNSTINGLDYVWNFGDGTPVDTESVLSLTHVYTAAGTYTVSLAASNSNACFKVADTAYATVVVDTIISSVLFTASPLDGCLPLSVNFTNASPSSLSYVWNYGDGSPLDTEYNTSHTYTAPGIYTAKMYGIGNACYKPTDTPSVTITIDSINIAPNFDITKIDSCSAFTASFNNTSIYSITPGSSAFTVFTWLFGDGTSYTGVAPPPHIYADTGVYTVTLIMADTTACHSPDTVSRAVSFRSYRVLAGFGAPDTVCEYSKFILSDSSTNASGYQWDFGNGYTASDAESYIYDTVGTFTITLVANNPSLCGLADTATREITVMPVPSALFTFDPTVPITNDSVTFTNNSINATRYLWDFGDGVTTSIVNPAHLFTKTGNFTVCLTAYNGSSCPSKLCKSVPTDIEPLADIPSAFSPNGDGVNDILYVRGAAIATMDLRIYNRWGELVFESTDQQYGWNGTYKGQPQPIDAYAYVLNVVFIDGTTKHKQGNVTLLR